METERTDDPSPPLFAVVHEGQTLARAVWTTDRELAEDMLRQIGSERPAALWIARRVARSDTSRG